MNKKSTASFFSLENKNIVITGATGILGKHFVEGLIGADGNVALVDCSEEVVSFAEELDSKFKNKVIGYKCNVADEMEVEYTCKRIKNDFGHISVLHNNAATKSSSLE